MLTSTKTQIKCPRHPNVTTVLYCKVCKKFMCGECEKAHTIFLGKDHKGSVVPTSSADNNFDCPFCVMCTTHIECPLDTFCKDCNSTPPVHHTLLPQSSLNFFNFHFCPLLFFFSFLLCEVQVGRKP